MMVVNDFKYAIRLLCKKPGFTLLSIFVMAAGIGLSVYMFSFFNTILFKDLYFEDGESLVQLNATQHGVDNGLINLHDYLEIRTHLKGLSEFGAYKNTSLNVSGRDSVRQYNAVFSEPNIFQLTRTTPILGRGFTDAENQAGAEPVVVIGFDMWQNQFGGDAHIIDQSVRINGKNHRIIGVMPQKYFFPNIAEMWVPLRQDAKQLTRDQVSGVNGLAHINKGVSIKEINRQLTLIMQRIEEEYSDTNNGVGVYADTLPLSGNAEGIVVVRSMQIVAVLILILASINVSNLLLSRAVERRKEIAIRMALGAPRSRLMSQIIWESTIICCVGGIIGLLVMAWGLDITERVVATFSIEKPPFWWKFGFDNFTLTLFLFLIVSTIVITGFIPAWKNSGGDFNAALRDGTRGALGKRAGRLNRILVINEIFISMTVLISATLMVFASYKDAHADYGAEIDGILTARISLDESNYESPEKQIQFANALQSHLENTIGVGDVMISTALPGSYSYKPMMAIDGREYVEEGRYPEANYIAVAPGSLDKLGVELKEGRYFNHSDDGLEKRTVIVTDSFVSRYFAGESPIGSRLRVVDLDSDKVEWLTIVGVVEHTIHGESYFDGEKNPSVYRPFTQAPRNAMTVAIQMKSDPSIALYALREALQEIDPDLPAYRIETYEEKIARNNAPIKFISTVFLLFGVAAVFLAASGIYGVMSNTIGQRTQEIGVKRALGAWESRITTEFLMSGLKQLLWGGIPGLIAGCAMGFAMSKALGTSSIALVVVAASIAVIIAGVVMTAIYLPTLRALRLEPGEALHCE